MGIVLAVVVEKNNTKNGSRETLKNQMGMPSSVIKHYSYESTKRILYITFVSGITYAYKSVPIDIANMLKTAGSKGKYFNHFIKGRFKYIKLRNK